MGKTQVENRIFLIDGSSFIFRAFYAIPHLSSQKGTPTNAIYGVVNMLLKIMKEFQPSYIAVVMDSKGKTRRHEAYRDYKANRPSLPEELAVQIPFIEKLIDALGIPVLQFEGYEADDVIATVSKKFSREGFEIVIIGADKDLYQIIDENVKMYDPMKDRWLDREYVEEKMGVPPEKVVDFLSLTGDHIDNIPGVPGIGEKTAQELINRFGSLENIYANLKEIEKKGIREKLEKHRDSAFISRALVKLETSLPIDISTEYLKLREKNLTALERIFRELGFSRLLAEFFPEKKLSPDYFSIISDLSALEEVIKMAEEKGELGIDLETTSLDPYTAQIVGISLTVDGEKAFYIPVGHSYLGAPSQLPVEKVIEKLKPPLENERIGKYGQNLKYDFTVLKKYGIHMSPVKGDSMIASYLLNPDRRHHNLDELSVEYLGHKMLTYSEVTGKGKGQISFAMVDVNTAAKYSCEDVVVAFRIAKKLENLLEEEGMMELYRKIEIPLIEVLAHMELSGIRIDPEKIKEVAEYLSGKIKNVQEKIWELAGEKFNLDSPIQLREILFKKLKLPGVKKGKTGYSTDSEVLQKLAQHHPICNYLLEYRGLAKLQSTYTYNLLKINPLTGRVHTSFNQTGTATGRLSSSEPNLQNIPVKGEEGKMIRSAFVPEEGWLFVSADYSQIELRVLAHLSGDEVLVQAFRNGEDIHRATASEIFGVKPEEVTPEMRRTAKTINFGIIYGISPHGLSTELGIGHSEAKELIEKYFARYRGVKKYIDSQLERARKEMVVRTIFGRKRHVPDINSASPAARGFAERVAINAPVQGSAADIIKVAMVNIYKRIRNREVNMKMLLQVHDELLFEVAKEDVEKAIEIIKTEMEHACALNVPLKVDIGTGKNWNEAKA